MSKCQIFNNILLYTFSNIYIFFTLKLIKNHKKKHECVLSMWRTWVLEKRNFIINMLYVHLDFFNFINHTYAIRI